MSNILQNLARFKSCAVYLRVAVEADLRVEVDVDPAIRLLLGQVAARFLVGDPRTWTDAQMAKILCGLRVCESDSTRSASPMALLVFIGWTTVTRWHQP